MIHPLKEQGHGSLMGVCPRARRREWTASVSVTEAQDPFQNSFSSMCTGRRRRLATDSSGSMFSVIPGGPWLRESLELCNDPLADDPLLPGDKGGVLFQF